MSKKKLQQLFDLAEELYAEELKKHGCLTMPYCWAKNGDGGFLAFSMDGVDSDKMENKLKELE